MTDRKSGITIEDVVDSEAWSAALDAMLARLESATGDASKSAADYIGRVAKGKLEHLGHSELTFSPSMPGEPPAMVSGALADSIISVRTGPQSAAVGPTTVYARIQELGGNMHGHPYMEFHKLYKGRVTKFRRGFVRLPPRPYLEPATDEAVNSGRVQDIYATHWARAIEG